MTQIITVGFENVNTLASQLRAAGAAIKVAKNVENFVITIVKQPQLASIEEILTYSEPLDKPDNITEDIAVENIKLPTVIDVELEENIEPIKKNRKKSAQSKSKLEILPVFDDDSDIPF